MIQHSSSPIASPVFCNHKSFQSSKTRTKPRLSLQTTSGEAMAIVDGWVIVYHPSHAVQSIFCNHFISQSPATYIRWAKNSEGWIFSMKPLAKAFRWNLFYATISIQVHYLITTHINTSMLRNHSKVAVYYAANIRPHAMYEKKHL